MPTPPPLVPPNSLPGAAPTLPVPPAVARAPAATQTPSVPGVFLDPVNEAAILAQIQRSGWRASQPQPVIDIVNDTYNGPTPVVKGYSMIITDPKTGTNQKVGLNYSPGGRQPWGITSAPEELPTPTKTSAVGSAETGWYMPDANGQYQMVVPAHTPNADEEILKAVKRHDAEAERNEKAANAAAGRGYQTNADYAKMANDAAAQGVSAATLQEKIRQFDIEQGEKTRQFDIQQAAKDRTDAASILKSGAETGLIGAQTGQTLQTTDIARQKLPGELSQQTATLESTQAATDKLRQDLLAGKAPTTVQATLGTTSPNYAQVNPLTGQVTFQQNANYQPKTQAEIAARIGQIQSLAQQKGQEVQAKVGQNGYTHDMALQEFNSWWDQNVGPQQQQLQAAQEEAQFQRAKEEATLRTAAYGEANTAAARQIEAFKATQGANAGMAMARPGYAEAVKQLSQGKVPSDMSVFAAQNVPNPADMVNQGTMNALKYIDPRAAAATGAPAPNLPGMDVAGLLNRTNYLPGAAAPPPPAAPLPGPPAAPAGPLPGGGVNGTGQGIGAGGMAALMPPPPLPPPLQSWTQSMPNFGAPTNPWDMAPNYSY